MLSREDFIRMHGNLDDPDKELLAYDPRAMASLVERGWFYFEKWEIDGQRVKQVRACTTGQGFSRQQVIAAYMAEVAKHAQS